MASSITLSAGVRQNQLRRLSLTGETDPTFNPGYRQFVDLTGITEIRVGTNMINETAHDQFFNPGVRRAFIASDDATFGMARMFALQAEGLGQTIEVFRDRGKAKEWLGI